MFFSSRIVPPTPPSLVKFSVERLLVDHRLVEFDAHQRPRAGADVAPVVAPGGGHGGHGGGGVVAGGRVRRARAGAGPRRQLAEQRARRDDSPQNVGAAGPGARAVPWPSVMVPGLKNCVVLAMVSSLFATPVSQ